MFSKIQKKSERKAKGKQLPNLKDIRALSSEITATLADRRTTDKF